MMDIQSNPTKADLLERVQNLAPLVTRHKEQFDTERRLSQPVVEAMIAADLFRLWTPRAFGGMAVSPKTLVEVVEAASAIDGSFGWCLTNGAAGAQMTAHLPDHRGQRWFSTPDCQISGSTAALGTARRVKGGYLVSGRWPFASGILSARLVYALCKVEGEGDPANPEILMCHFERDEVDVLDTWHAIGLRGSGSHDIVIHERLVPHDRCHHIAGDTPLQSGQLFRFPIVTLLSLSVAIVPLGIAKAAIAAFADMSDKTRAGTANPFRDRELIQDSIGRAEALRRASRALIMSALDDLDATLDQGGRPLVEARANFRLAIAHAAESSLRVVEMVVNCAGAAAIFESAPLSRHLRDAQVATKHVAVGPHLFALGGRIALGMEPGMARF